MHKFSPTIQTPRFVLRHFNIEDTASLFQNFLDPLTVEHWRTRNKTLDETQERVLRMIHHWEEHGFGDWAIEDKQSGQMIGFCGNHYITGMSEVNLGYMLNRSYWGKGIATEVSLIALAFAFEETTLDQVVGVTLRHNVASIKILEKCAMKFWKEIVRHEEPRVVYSITREECVESKRFATSN